MMNTDRSRCTEFTNRGICIVTKSVRNSAFYSLSIVRICIASPFHAKSIFRFLFTSSFILDLFAFPQDTHLHEPYAPISKSTARNALCFRFIPCLFVAKCFENSKFCYKTNKKVGSVDDVEKSRYGIRCSR